MITKTDANRNDKIAERTTKDWWEPGSEFFGQFYIEGDDSLEGFLKKKNLSLDERTQIEVDGIINLLSLTGKESLLDLPCGYGRHSIQLAKRGFKVTGCDLNPTHLEKASKKAEQEGVKVNWILGNMRDVKIEHKFDGIINMFYSFGFFESDSENIGVLKNFYDHLKPEGRFLLHTDVNIPYLLSGEYQHYEERTLSSGAKLIIQDDYDFQTKRINGSWTIYRGKEEVKKNYSVRVYECEEFVSMCEHVGFQNVACYSSWEKMPYSSQSEEIMVVATK